MIAITRQEGEAIVVGDDIVIQVIEVDGDTVVIKILTPDGVTVEPSECVAMYRD